MNSKEISTGQRPAIDWNEVHKRVRDSQAAIEQGWLPGPEERQRILRARARALSREPKKESAGESIEVVEFLLAHERYGIETSFARGVYPLRELTPVPCTPPYVLGVINVRGQILSVIDLKKFFDLPERGLGDLNKVIILASDTMEFGILADVIIGVSALSLKGLQPAPPTFTGVHEEYFRGITGDRTVILDAGKILLDAAIVVNEEVL